MKPVWTEFPSVAAITPRARGYFLAQATQRERRWRAAVVIISMLLVATTIIGITLLLHVLFSDDPPLSDRVTLAVAVAIIPGTLALALISMYRTGQRRAIRQRLEAPSCSACSYELVGLTAEDHVVNCPECGSRQVVAASPLGATGP